MQEVNIYVETAARGPREQTAKYVYILELKTPKGAATLTKEGSIRGTKNHIEIMALKMALERVNMRVSLNLYIDSTYVSHAFAMGYPEKWKGNGWKTAKGTPVANQEEWKETLDLLYGKPFRVHINETHEYREWMRREIGKEHGNV